MWTETEHIEPTCQHQEPPSAEDEAPLELATAPVKERNLPQRPAGAGLRGPYGWPVPSSLSPNPAEARARIQLPEFDALLLEKARVISGHFPAAEAQYRYRCGTDANGQHSDLPHFERVFRIAKLAGRREGGAGSGRLRRAPDSDGVALRAARGGRIPGFLPQGAAVPAIPHGPASGPGLALGPPSSPFSSGARRFTSATCCAKDSACAPAPTLRMPISVTSSGA